MSRLLFAMASGAFLSMTLAGSAQQAPRDVLLGGSMEQYVGDLNFGGSCYVGRGPSTFQRSGSGLTAAISFAEIVDSGDPPAVFDLSGTAVLTFATGRTGRIRFPGAVNAPPAVFIPRFRNYSETYNAVASRLMVSFEILFPDCNLTVSANYANP
jgi:hypothetical protein